MSRVVTWESGMPSLPRAVVAIGVFDGVHLGHQALLAETIADAGSRGAASAVITFDRDPDQVVTPDAAAPQLLTLDDKLAFISECGIDTILVVPFTESIAALSPSAFLDSVVSPSLDLVAIHVGEDFRFGAKASGDVNTLAAWASALGIDVVGERLVTEDGAPVTSTRIRGLVAEGNVEEAAVLLGRPHRVAGTVGQGRGAGRELGFPTANLRPAAFAALPADGVYAGLAIQDRRDAWAAAISVGTPPTFPEARDYLEVHLIGFDGDLYGSGLAIEFLTRLRDQQRFNDPDELSAAIAEDVERAAEIADEAADENADEAPPEAPLEGTDMWDADANTEAVPAPAPEDGEWVEVAQTRAAGTMAAIAGSFGRPAILLAMPLDAANIPYQWDPFSPDRASVGVSLFARSFRLLVPAEFAGEAIRLLAEEEAAAEESPRRDESSEWEAYREAVEELDDEDLVDDKAALAAAQAAVNEASTPGTFATIDPAMVEPGSLNIDEWTWTYLAEGFAPGPIEWLSRALNEAEIATLWDPFPPEKRAEFWGRTNLTVFVPLIELESARRIAEETGVLGEQVEEGEGE